MERCFRAEADKLAGVRMDRSWLYKEPPISSTCLNIMHTICFYHSVTQSSPTSEKIQAFKKIAVPPVCNPQGSFAPPPLLLREVPLFKQTKWNSVSALIFMDFCHKICTLLSQCKRRWKVEGVQNLRQGEQAHKGRPATPWMGPQRTAAGTWWSCLFRSCLKWSRPSTEMDTLSDQGGEGGVNQRSE